MTTYLITGINRGIGLAFLETIAANPENLLIGTVRTPEIAKEIEDLGYKNVKVIVVEMTMNDDQFKEAFEDLETLTPDGIDVVIHNTGAGASPGRLLLRMEEQPDDEFDYVYDVNVKGSARFYRTIYPRLEKNGKPLKLIFLSSMAGSITEMLAPCGPYGISKAALNHMVKQIAMQRKDKGDIVIPLHPGHVDTRMSDEVRHYEIVKKVMISTEQSVKQMLEVIEKLTPEDNGKFFTYTGSEMQY